MRVGGLGDSLVSGIHSEGSRECMHAVRSSREKKGEEEKEDYIYVCGKRREKETEELIQTEIKKNRIFIYGQKGKGKNVYTGKYK